MTDISIVEDQPTGVPLPAWTGRTKPERLPIAGRQCRLEPFDPDRHAAGLYSAYASDTDGRNWTYLPYGPFPSLQAYTEFATATYCGDDPLFFAIVDPVHTAPLGVASLMRIDPANGVIEVGHISFSPALQRSRIATEAMYLLMAHVFDTLRYRRYEWKCDALNTPSRRAAERLGFRYEGTFRQAAVVKGRNRDTAWFSVIDTEWPAAKAAFEAWLDPVNFDEAGRQQRTLAGLRESVGG